MKQRTSRLLKTIGIALVAASLWPSFVVTASRATLAASCSVPAATAAATVNGGKDNGLVKHTDVNQNKNTTPDVVVHFVTTAATPLNPGFNGFNSNLKNAVEYYDTNFQYILTTLSPGWLRFPGGTDSEAFDWASGEIVSAWVDALAANPYQHDINCQAQAIVAAKGGSSFSDFAAMATNVGDAKIIVSVNAFKDTPQSAQDFARYALANHIPVAAWELANEPYTWPKFGQFFTDATDYANKMKPYRDAIKLADPNAVVALYFSEAGHRNTGWDNALARYRPRYWDAVTYHEYVYPGDLNPENPKAFDELMAAANGNLFSNTTTHVTKYLMPRNKRGMTYLISEVSPTAGQGGVLLGTLYGGIYSAEFSLRMSTLPQVKHVASFQMLSRAGIDQTKDDSKAVLDAYDKDGTTTNTSGFDFGFFLSAQAAGEAVANAALHNSIGVYATTTTGGPTAPISDGGSIPAVYAQAYEGGNGKRYVVLTNKGASAAVAQIKQDGVVRTNEMDMTFVTGTDPTLANTNAPPNNVQIQTQKVTPGAVTIPPYSVVRLEWSIAPPVVSLSFPDPPKGTGGWYNGPVTGTVTARSTVGNDIKSITCKRASAIDPEGLNSLSASATVDTTTEGNPVKVLCMATDSAGDRGEAVAPLMIDTKPPATTATTHLRTLRGVPVGLEVDLSAVDNLSGVATTESSVDHGTTWKFGRIVFLCGGTHTLLFRSTDVAGNAEKPKSITVSAPSCAP